MGKDYGGCGRSGVDLSGERHVAVKHMKGVWLLKAGEVRQKREEGEAEGVGVRREVKWEMRAKREVGNEWV